MSLSPSSEAGDQTGDIPSTPSSPGVSSRRFCVPPQDTGLFLEYLQLYPVMFRMSSAQREQSHLEFTLNRNVGLIAAQRPPSAGRRR